MRGPRGLTPMHLAALSPAAAAISRLLAAKCAPGPAAWFWVTADDGLTPASFAERLGTPERNADMLQRAIVAGAPCEFGKKNPSFVLTRTPCRTLHSLVRHAPITEVA